MSFMMMNRHPSSKSVHDDRLLRDALDLYWNSLEGPKYLIELPNAGHGREQNRDWVLSGLGAFFRQVPSGRRLPALSGTTTRRASGDLVLLIQSDPAPISARLWTAQAKDRDFRASPWTPSLLKAEATITVTLAKAENGHTAAFVDLEYQLGGISFHLTTSFFEPGITVREAAKAGP